MRRRVGLLLALGALVALVGVAPAAAAPRGGESDVSDTSPEPGQTITVTAADLLPGSDARIIFLPEEELGTVTVNDAGTFSERVQIPRHTTNGPKQIVVLGLDSEGLLAYLVTDIEVVGDPASIDLSDHALTPNETVTISGRRFRASTEVYAALFPEGVLLGTPTTDGDGGLRFTFDMPDTLLNGEHVIVVGGPEATGAYASLEVRADVTGGVGVAAPVIPGTGGQLLEHLLNTTTTVRPTLPPTSATSTTRAPELPRRSSGSNGAWLVLVLLLLLVLTAAGITWLRTQDGRYWLERRRERRAHRH